MRARSDIQCLIKMFHMFCFYISWLLNYHIDAAFHFHKTRLHMYLFPVAYVSCSYVMICLMFHQKIYLIDYHFLLNNVLYCSIPVKYISKAYIVPVH